jgi:Leucine-rich repeat (LRR) protein
MKVQYFKSRNSLFLIGCLALNNVLAQGAAEIISDLQFLDQNFQDCVLENASDNGWDTVDEMTNLDCYDSNIASASGIEQLIALTDLTLWRNNLEEIDLSANTDLVYLDLDENNLTSVNLDTNSKLENLFISDNLLTSIDISNNSNIYQLELNNDYLTSIELGNNLDLEYLYLDSNFITQIDISNNTNLFELDLDDNNLSSIDLSNNTALTELDIDRNQLTSIDVSSNTGLDNLELKNNLLTTIDVSNNTGLTELDLHQNLLTTIDVSSNTELVYLDVDNNLLETINIDSNQNLEELWIIENLLNQAAHDYLESLDGIGGLFVNKSASPMVVETIASSSELSFVLATGGNTSSAEFFGGSSADGGITQGNSFFQSENLTIGGGTAPQSADVGKAGEIFIVMRDKQADSDTFYYRDETGNFIRWNTNFNSLGAAYEISSLGSMESFSIYNGTILDGSYRFFLGYSLADGSGPLHFNGQAMQVNISPDTELTLDEDVSDSVEEDEWDYFQVSNATKVELSNLSGDVDLYVSNSTPPYIFRL